MHKRFTVTYFIIRMMVWFSTIRPRIVFARALRTGKIPERWLKPESELTRKIMGELHGENQWDYTKRTVAGVYMGFIYRSMLLYVFADVLERPIQADLEGLLKPLRFEEVIDPEFEKEALQDAIKIREIYAQLLARGVGGGEYELMWKRNLCVMDEIISSYHNQSDSIPTGQ